MLILILIEIVLLCVIAAELWLGIAIFGAPGDHIVVEREKRPGMYWFVMTIHLVIVIAIPALASQVHSLQ